MIKTLTKGALIAALCVGAGGCAAPAQDDGELISRAHQTLSLAPKGLYPLSAEATALADGRTIIDVALTPIPHPVQESDEIPLHQGGDFTAVLVYVDRANGGRDLINVFSKNDLTQIGPGGGCIHVFVNASAGDRLFIGAVVKLTGETRARIAAAPITTVTPGQWPFSVLDDHTLPPP